MSPITLRAGVQLSSFGVGASPAPQTWTPVTQSASFTGNTALLLTDGTVMVQELQTTHWWRLTPDSTGDYINGTWTQLASMPSGYAPLYYASAVLPDGRVVVEGGEYNTPSPPGPSSGLPPPPLSIPPPGNETNLGAIYTPATNTWASITPPTGWSSIGDAAGIVRPDGTFMLAGFFYSQIALLNATTLTWTASTPAGKADNYSEEGWTLLPNGKVLAVDVWVSTASELYTQSSNSWASGGSTVVNLADMSPCEEMGPAVLRPDGTVFAIGATNSTAIYHTATSTWSAGPVMPVGLGVADGPAAPLPNGNVLMVASPTSSTNCYGVGSQYFEFNGSTLTSVPAPPNAASSPAYAGRMLVLPTGQIFFTGFGGQPQIYTPGGTYLAAWQPTLTSVPTTLTRGVSNYTISGTQFNGRTQGAMYGDNAQMATNYPLVRITNNTTNHVQYVPTHSFSTMAVATGSATVSAQLDIPQTIEVGASSLTVVANGIPSQPIGVSVVATVPVCAPDGIFCNGFE